MSTSIKFLIYLFYLIVGFGDLTLQPIIPHIFMVFVIIFGIWVLSLLVANIQIHITPNADEIAAYKSILKLQANVKKENMQIGIKYLIDRKLATKSLRDPHKPFVENIVNLIKYQNKFRSNFKYTTKSRNDIEDYLDKFMKDLSIYKQGMKYALFKKVYFTTNKLIDRLNPLMSKCEKILNMAQDMKKMSYATDNLAKAMTVFNTVGKVRGMFRIFFKFILDYLFIFILDIHLIFLF
jgi:hypothetical protein